MKVILYTGKYMPPILFSTLLLHQKWANLRLSKFFFFFNQVWTNLRQDKIVHERAKKCKANIHLYSECYVICMIFFHEKYHHRMQKYYIRKFLQFLKHAFQKWLWSISFTISDTCFSKVVYMINTYSL